MLLLAATMRVLPHIVSRIGQSVPNEASTLQSPVTPSQDIHPVSPILLISTVLFVILLFEAAYGHTLLGYIAYPDHPAIHKLLNFIQQWGPGKSPVNGVIEYGNTVLVSCGPGLYSVNDLTVIKQILESCGRSEDSEYNSSLLSKSQYEAAVSLGRTLDEAEWRKSRLPTQTVERSAKGQYTLFEPGADASLHCFCEQLDKAAVEKDNSCRLSERLQSFAFDAVSTILCSRRLESSDTETSIASSTIHHSNATSIPHWAIPNDFATIPGAEALGYFVKALFLNLLREPEALGRLMAEFNLARQSCELDNFPTWQQVRVLPYLDACIKETARLHPPFGLRLDRIVPYGGTTLFGNALKYGSLVGIDARVVHQSKALFGDDADTWNPCRWFSEEDDQLAMESNLLTFGFGKAVCPGRTITELIIYKLVPTILQRYEICLVHSVHQQNSSNLWQEANIVFDVSIARRDESEKCISSDNYTEKRCAVEKCVRLAVAD